MLKNIKPTNKFRVMYYPAGKPDGLIAGYANTIEDAVKIAKHRKPATIWNQWNREIGKDKKPHYHAILVKMVAAVQE